MSLTKAPTFEYFLPDTASTEQLGALLVDLLTDRATVYLIGNLGAGKTTFVRGALRRLGHKGAVKSPTFTLVEPYELRHLKVFHFDLYRLQDPEELDWIGVRDYFQKGSICFIEWPEKGQDNLPYPDLKITFLPDLAGRKVRIQVCSSSSHKIIKALFDLGSVLIP